MTKDGQSRRVLTVIVAAEIIDPLAVAVALGDAEWVQRSRQWAGEMAAIAPPPGAWQQAGPDRGYGAATDFDEAWDVARHALALVTRLELPLGVAIHAGEVLVTGEDVTGAHLLTAMRAAQLAGPGAVIITEPAAALAGARLRGALDAGVWSPPGLPIAWRLWVLGSRALRETPSDASGLRRASLLTGRERQIVSLVAAGHTNRAISGHLAIAEGTVDRHLANIYRKLGFHSRSETARWAVEQGISLTPFTER
jgi:DNA-binding NarL/FixJ family response regulator